MICLQEVPLDPNLVYKTLSDHLEGTAHGQILDNLATDQYATQEEVNTYIFICLSIYLSNYLISVYIYIFVKSSWGEILDNLATDQYATQEEVKIYYLSICLSIVLSICLYIYQSKYLFT